MGYYYEKPDGIKNYFTIINPDGSFWGYAASGYDAAIICEHLNHAEKLQDLAKSYRYDLRKGRDA